MPDITMCNNEVCPIKDTCYRHTATPDEFWQSWSYFEYDWKNEICEYYWKD